MKTHFFPHEDDGSCDQASCGTRLGDRSNLTTNWAYVDCRNCLKCKDKIITAHQREETAIVEQMGDMVAFVKSQEYRP